MSAVRATDLSLGCQASAKQFEPKALLESATPAEGCGVDTARFLRDFGAEVLPRLRRAYE